MDEIGTKGVEQAQMDAAGLFREESYTDLKVGSIRRLAPVRTDGSPDPSRRELFFGQSQVMTRGGPVPVEFEIEAAGLSEAVQRFPEFVQRGIESLVAEAREYQRQSASSLIIPGGGPGKIQMP